ncbi:MAG: DNA-formamidopyrimidine glycosylase family protein, partial [Candidatus Sulfotelmatobacter sp.]
MPELPEVETIARGLAKRVTGDVIESVWLGQKTDLLKSPAPEIAATLEQRRIATVHRMGKHIVFELEHVERAPVPAESRRPKGTQKRSKARSSKAHAG